MLSFFEDASTLVGYADPACPIFGCHRPRKKDPVPRLHFDPLACPRSLKVQVFYNIQATWIFRSGWKAATAIYSFLMIHFLKLNFGDPFSFIDPSPLPMDTWLPEIFSDTFVGSLSRRSSHHLTYYFMGRDRPPTLGSTEFETLALPCENYKWQLHDQSPWSNRGSRGDWSIIVETEDLVHCWIFQDNKQH